MLKASSGPRGALGPLGSPRHRLGFHALVVTIGLVVGGAFQSAARQFLPPGPAKEFLTAGLAPYLDPQSINLILLKFTLGPVAIDVSLISLLGLLIAYLIARSLF
jgi:hypothetical protein